MKQQKSNILIRKQKKYNPNRGNQSGKGELTVFQFTIFQMEISTTDLTPNIFEMQEKKKKNQSLPWSWARGSKAWWRETESFDEPHESWSPTRT